MFGAPSGELLDNQQRTPCVQTWTKCTGSGTGLTFHGVQDIHSIFKADCERSLTSVSQVSSLGPTSGFQIFPGPAGPNRDSRRNHKLEVFFFIFLY